MIQICNILEDAREKHRHELCLDDTWDLPKDIYIAENKYITDMTISPELEKYIDETIEKKIKKIKKAILLTTEESLYELWDNKYDERWNEY